MAKLPRVLRLCSDYMTPVPGAPDELIKHRFLCHGGGLLFVGATGIGKSTMAVQMMLSFALGHEAFGLEPTRPLTSLMVQAENDDGDIAEMRDGILDGMGLSAEEIDECNNRVLMATEYYRTGKEFINDVMRPLAEHYRPDLIWLDPAFAYFGGATNDQESVSGFLRNNLNGMLKELECAVVINHHTNKPSPDRDKALAGYAAYVGAGSAEWANWSRAMLYLAPHGREYKLICGKRSARLSWKERIVRHDEGRICWLDPTSA